MCICINCLYVHRCSTYQAIQKQHNQHYNKFNKDFHPIDTIIHVNLYNNYNSIETDWDIAECLSFIDKPGNWVH